MLDEPHPEVTEGFGKRRTFLGKSFGDLELAERGELPSGGFELFALGRAVRSAAALAEFDLGPSDQVVDEPCEKFARSAVLSSSCSRSQVTPGLA